MFARLVRALLLIASLFAVVVTIRIATLVRPVDSIELAVLERADRIARGVPAFVEPTRDEGQALMPAVPLAVAPLVGTFGVDTWQPRVLALAAILLTLALVAAIVRLETASWTMAACSAGFLAIGLVLLAAPPDVPRPELLMMPLVLAGFFSLRLSDDFGGPLLAAVWFSAALFTAPHAAWFIAAAIAALALDNRQRLLVFVLVLAVVAGGGHVLMSRLWGPWFNAAAWGDPLRGLQWNVAEPLRYVGGELLGTLGVLTLAAVLSFALPTPPWRGKGGLWMCLGLAALAGGLVATQHAEFDAGTLAPSLVALAVLGPVSMHRVLGHLSAWPGSSRLAGQGVVLTALTLQFVMLFASAQAGVQ